MRIIVCGGRDYHDQMKVNETLDELHARKQITFLFHGNARGADMCGSLWADRHPFVRNRPVPARWEKFGRKAGPIRNQTMLGQGIDLVVAFPGGRGTADMVKRAKAAGVEVKQVG